MFKMNFIKKKMENWKAGRGKVDILAQQKEADVIRDGCRLGLPAQQQEVDVMCEDIAKPLTRFSNVRGLPLTLKNALSHSFYLSKTILNRFLGRVPQAHTLRSISAVRFVPQGARGNRMR